MSPAKWPVLLLFLLMPAAVMALSSDSEQPISMEADNLEIDENRQVSIYQGHVKMRQGSLHIQADKIILHFDAHNNLQWLEISGQPATFNQLNDQQQTVSGSALTIHYHDSDSVMKLMGQARYQSHLDTLESETITLNTKTNALQAGDQNGKERVKMLIQPSKPPSADE